MKYYGSILFILPILILTSCDYTTYIAVRNYREPCQVQVSYEQRPNYFYNNDTLSVKHLDDDGLGPSIVRTNDSAGSYHFIAPRDREIALRPSALNFQPIREIRIVNADSAWTTHLWDRKEYKRLKKAGYIKTKGFLFTSSIWLDNK